VGAVVTPAGAARLPATSAVPAYTAITPAAPAGADSLVGDRLGMFSLTLEGHAEAVRFIKSFGLPMLVSVSGVWWAAGDRRVLLPISGVAERRSCRKRGRHRPCGCFLMRACHSTVCRCWVAAATPRRQ
jgi:hypothetical protein